MVPLLTLALEHDLSPSFPMAMAPSCPGSTSTSRWSISASFGSVRQHVRGQAVFQDRTCFGHIQYRVWIDGGHEILGSPNNFGGIGADVPRVTCRLVETKN